VPEGIGSWLIAIKPPAPGADPYLSMAVLKKAAGIVIREGTGITRVVDIAGELLCGGIQPAYTPTEGSRP